MPQTCGVDSREISGVPGSAGSDAESVIAISFLTLLYVTATHLHLLLEGGGGRGELTRRNFLSLRGAQATKHAGMYPTPSFWGASETSEPGNPLPRIWVRISGPGASRRPGM